jgi:hypothetical protein
VTRALVLLVIAGCGAQAVRTNAPRSGALPRCYDLPGAARYSLRIGPDGAAYWIERAVSYDFDGNSHGVDRLVRMDRATGATSVLASGVAAPIRLLRDGRILYKQAGDVSTIVLYVPAGGTRTLTPYDVDVSHFEVTPDERTVVFAAQGRGGKAIYAASLDEGAPRWLADADEIYAADATSAIVARGKVVMRVPLAGGAPTTIAQFDKTEPYDAIGGYIVHYDETHFYARPIAGGQDRLVLGPPGGWQMTGAPDHVFLTRRDGAQGVALRIEGATTRELPRLAGGVALDGAEPVDGEILGLVAQDTDHDGAPDDARDEVDVCELPTRGTAQVPLRHVPKRVAAGEAKLDAVAKQARATWQVIEDPPGPMTVDLHVDARAGDQLAPLRARIRALAGPVIAALGDPELRVELIFADGRRAASFTDDVLHRRVSVAGIGEAVVSEPGEYDLEVMRSLVVRDDKQQQILCSGEVKNRSDHAIAGAVADCVAGRTDEPVTITPDPLPPGGVGLYAGNQPDVPDADLAITYRAGVTPLLALDDKNEEEQKKLYVAAAAAYDRSQLTLWSWRVEDGTVTAELDPPSGFADFSNAAQEVAATAAFDALASPLRSATGAGASAPVTIRIHLADGEIREYDADGLHAPREP